MKQNKTGGVRLAKMLADGKIDRGGLFIDTYNQTVSRIAGTIQVGIDFRNLYYVSQICETKWMYVLWMKCRMERAGHWRQTTSRQGESISNTITYGEQQAYWLFMKQIDVNLFGYSRDYKGKIINYHRVFVSNTIHTSSGSGGNTDQIVVMVYETDW